MTTYPLTPSTQPPPATLPLPRLNLTPRDRAPIAVSLALLFASTASIALYALRVSATGHFTFFFMNWNLILAWIPFLCALIAYALYPDRSLSTRGAMLFFGGVWFLFYPNAPYILTDLMHLYDSGAIIFWLDLSMLLSYAFTGLLLGYVSLYLMQTLIAQSFGAVAGWAFVVLIHSLSSFGIYLGRVLRWNSWDILANPLSLAADILDRFINPLAHPRTWGVSVFFTVLCLSTYLVLVAFTQLGQASKTTR